MKSKKFEKKLVLKKRTILNLNTNEMNDVKGGDTAHSVCFCITMSGCLTYCGVGGAQC